MIHIHGIWDTPRPKRSNVRVSERLQREVIEDLKRTKQRKEASNDNGPDKRNAHVMASKLFRQTGEMA